MEIVARHLHSGLQCEPSHDPNGRSGRGNENLLRNPPQALAWTESISNKGSDAQFDQGCHRKDCNLKAC